METTHQAQTMLSEEFLAGTIEEIRQLTELQAARFTRGEELELVEAEVAAPEPRLSDHPYDMVVELARVSDRLIETRDRLAMEKSRADVAVRDLAAVNQRMMAARALLHDAQMEAHGAVEQVAYLEGRCTALEELVRQAMGTSRISRWKWRRHNQRHINRLLDET